MLESRHPLLLFGIPGIVLSSLATNCQVMFSTLLASGMKRAFVGLAVIAVTLMGLFAMMVGLILT